MNNPPSNRQPELGSVAYLPVIKRTQAGLLLDGGTLGELLLPARDIIWPDEEKPATVKVFIYPDQDSKPRVTTQMPCLLPGEVGRLKVVGNMPGGAFLDWGLPKDLLLPRNEQTNQPEVGRWQTVIVLRDHELRPFASTRLDRHVEKTCTEFKQGDAVPLLVIQRTDLGYKVVVASRYWGLLICDEGQAVRLGQQLTGYVQRLRDDQRLSVSLNPPGAAKRDGLPEQILARLQVSNGRLPLSDKSDPAAIRDAFRCSKNAFKQAIGKLYKERKIVIEVQGIRLPDAKNP